MKKAFVITAVSCTLLSFCGCGFLGFQYLTLENRYQTLEAASSQLEKDNSDLNTKLADSTAQLKDNAAQLEEKESYLEGQKEYISELSEQINTLSQEKDSSESESSQDSAYENPDYEDSEDLYPDLYAETPDSDTENTEKIAYLTFDDGPSDLTPKVLDLLDQYQAKATFFVVCKNNEEYAEYLSEIVRRGHTLALHSYSHNYNEIYASKDAFHQDYEKVFGWVVETTGYTPFLYRFPGGSNNGSSYVGSAIRKEMARRGFQYFDWNVSSGDGSNLTTTSNIIDNICNNIDHVENPVVLMHDGSGKNATLAALPTVLQNLSDAGYEFRSLDQTVSPVQFR